MVDAWPVCALPQRIARHICLQRQLLQQVCVVQCCVSLVSRACAHKVETCNGWTRAGGGRAAPGRGARTSEPLVVHDVTYAALATPEAQGNGPMTQHEAPQNEGSTVRSQPIHNPAQRYHVRVHACAGVAVLPTDAATGE